MIRAHPRQIAAIHAEAKRLGMDDGSRRDLMEATAGKRSAAELNSLEAEAVLRRMRGLGGRPLSAVAAGKYAPILRALWLSAYHLGAVRKRDDRALHAFVKRQTSIDHTRFLTEWAEANKTIIAIKAMCERAGVDWPTEGSVTNQKQAVVRAIIRRLGAAGAVVEAPRLEGLDNAALDRLQARLGARLRIALGMDREAAHG